MSERVTAQIQLTFQVNYDHDGPLAERMKAAEAIGHDLLQGVRSDCRGSEDRLRFKQVQDPRIMFVTQDDGDSFL